MKYEQYLKKQQEHSKYKGPKKVRNNEESEVLRHLAEKLLLDPELSLPYGYGFDDYITDLRQKKLAASSDVFMTALRNIFQKLSYRSDIELVRFHEHAIIEKTKIEFKDKARAVILDNIIREIKQIRENKPANLKILKKVVPNKEFLEAALKDSGNNNIYYSHL